MPQNAIGPWKTKKLVLCSRTRTNSVSAKLNLPKKESRQAGSEQKQSPEREGRLGYRGRDVENGSLKGRV